MGRIPTITSQVSANSGRTTQGVPSPTASGAAFGAQVGAATQMLAQGLGDLATGIEQRRKKKAEEAVANAVATSDFTSRELNLRNEVGPDAAGYQERTLSEYDAFIDEQAEAIEDDEARQIFKDRMRAQRPNVSSRAAQYEFTTGAEYSKDQANVSLTALDNKIRLDPAQFDTFIEQGEAVIDTRTDVPAAVREGMKQAWRQNSARARFDGLLDGASSVEELDAIEQELRDPEAAGRDWTTYLSPGDTDTLLRTIGSARTSIYTKQDADARAAIDTLEARASDPTVLIPREELAAVQEVVKQSANPVTLARMARISRDQEIIAQQRVLPVAEQREAVAGVKVSLPPVVNSAINEAAGAFGVSASYLAATADREYGMYLKGDPATIDYGKGNAQGASSATGVMQIIDGTFLSVMKTAGVADIIGVNLEGMSDAQILELRKDARTNIMAGAAYAAINARQIGAILGRAPTDAELYMAHFLGGGGASQLLRGVVSNPTASAADAMPQAAAANPTIFYRPDGTANTLQQVYNNLAAKHGTSQTGVEYGDRQTRQAVLDATEKGIATDPMSTAAGVGVYTLSDLEAEGGFGQRGQDARSVASYYNIPLDQMKPFTVSETEDLTRQLADANADQALAILARVQEMGGDMARAGLRQLGEKDDTLAYAGRLQMETGQAGPAGDIVRGQKRLTENPEIKSQIGASDADISREFFNATGSSLMGLAPAQRSAVEKAALAHYVETYVAKGGAGSFNADAFGKSITAVMGGRQGAPAFEEINGVKTVLPPGVTGADVENALQVMTLVDWASMSHVGLPPKYIDGQVVDPQDIADEATLTAVGGGLYRVNLGDGSTLTTGRIDPNGRLETYLMVLSADKLRRAITRNEAARATGTDRQDNLVPPIPRQQPDAAAIQQYLNGTP